MKKIKIRIICIFLYLLFFVVVEESIKTGEDSFKDKAINEEVLVA